MSKPHAPQTRLDFVLNAFVVCSVYLRNYRRDKVSSVRMNVGLKSVASQR
jgi:hypothetical protein